MAVVWVSDLSVGSGEALEPCSSCMLAFGMLSLMYA